MGDNTPEVIDLKCQNCGAEFRLRPTKGRLPKGPVKCPDCGQQIPVPDDSAEPPPPMAAVIRPKKGSSDSSIEMDALAQAMADVPAGGGTLIGAPIAVGFERAETKVNEFGPVPSEAFDDDEPQQRETAKLPRKQLHTDLDETSESVFNNTTRHPWENELPPDDATEQITSEVEREDTVNDAQVLDDKRTTRPNLAANKPGGKPKLSDLLKKVRQKRGVHPTQPMVPIPSLPKKSAEEIFGDFDEVIDESADDLVSSAAALKTQKLKKPSRKSEPLKMDPTIETTIRETMRDDLGMAGENVGSGYIRIPTAEILDVIGAGSYRLKVENVVYEPVDEKGLVRLIKGGVLMGAEQIAEADGDWMPVDEHPVIQELRKRMAEEAHRLLAEVASAAPASEAEEEAQADLDEVFELEDLEEESYTPPPLPSAPDDATIESPPPVVEDDGFFDEQPDTVPLPSIAPPAEGLMNTSAVDEIAGAIEAEKPGLFDGTSVVNEIADAVGDPGPVADSAPEAQHDEFDAPEPTPFEEDSFGSGDSFAADDAGTPAVEMSKEEVDEYLDEPVAKKSNAGLLVMVLVLILAAVGVVGSAYMGFINIPGITPPAPKPAINAVKDPPPTNNQNNAVATADAGTDEDQGAELEENPLETAQAAYDAEATPETAAALVEQLVAAEQNDKAIEVLEEAVKMEGGDVLQAKLDELKPPPPTPKGPQVIAPADWSNAASVDIKRHKVFEVDYQGKRYQVIIDRGQPLRGWRAVLASYRLCEMMKCGFKIPNTFEFSMKKADWQAFSKESGVRIAGASFTKAEEEELLLGAMVEKLPEAALWPIDASGIWRDLIDDPETATKPLVETLDKAADKEAIAAQLGENGAKLAGPALSSLLVFDYLTNNFSRIGRGESTAVKDGAFYSVHNFDCFQTRTSTRVKGRFRWASRFNREQIDSLRELKPEEIDLVLFPDASRAEQSALKVFWKQRDEIIERVDDQLKGGEDKTFF